jgi:solute carrier family 25 phosphate transporter 3
MSPYRSNPFFSTASSFFLPSVGDKVDQAVAQGKDFAKDAQNKGQELLGKADNKVQDAKEAVKVAAKQPPTGVDLYAR